MWVCALACVYAFARLRPRVVHARTHVTLLRYSIICECAYTSIENQQSQIYISAATNFDSYLRFDNGREGKIAKDFDKHGEGNHIVRG